MLRFILPYFYGQYYIKERMKSRDLFVILAKKHVNMILTIHLNLNWLQIFDLSKFKKKIS